MKALTLSLVLVTLSAHAQAAEIQWAKGPFWQAPQINEITKTMISSDKELVESCKSYKRLVDNAVQREITDYTIQRFERARTAPLPSSMGIAFETSFVLSDLDNGYIIESESHVANASKDKGEESLPLYTQEKAITGVYVNNLTDIKINAASNSLTAFSRQLGLKDSKVSILHSKGKVVVVAEGRDVACDLLMKQASLTSDLPSYVRLPEEAAKEIVNFYYFKVSPLIASAINKPGDSSMIKAAKLGFRLGKVLEEKTDRIGDELLEKQIANIMDLSFVTKTLNPSSKLIEVNGKKVLDIRSNIEGAKVRVNLEVQ